MFFSNNLSDIDHCFFSKLGGNSKKIYSSLNCGMGSSDNKSHVKKNLSYISRYYDLSSKNLITMYQTHSTKCKVIKNNTLEPIKADSLVTNQANLILCVLSADCAPILFYDPKKKGYRCLPRRMERCAKRRCREYSKINEKLWF